MGGLAFCRLPETMQKPGLFGDNRLVYTGYYWRPFFITLGGSLIGDIAGGLEVRSERLHMANSSIAVLVAVPGN